MNGTGLYWISYSSGDEPLGVCAVFAHSYDQAHEQGERLAPQGTVATMVAMIPNLPAGMPLNRLLTGEEIERAGWGKRYYSREEFEADGNVIDESPNPD